MEKDYIRTPILQTLRKSPLELIMNHFDCVKHGTLTLEKTMDYYFKEDYIKFKKYSERIDKFEQRADRIKGNIRNHLPKFIFLPINKVDFLMLLKELDGMLDSAKDVAVLMEMRETKVPKNIQEDLKKLIDKVNEVVYTMEKVMELFNTLLETSFGGKPRQEIKNVIYKLHKLEHESDVIEKQISKNLFNITDMDPIAIVHLLKITERIGIIPDRAENAGDRIRAMLAR